MVNGINLWCAVTRAPASVGVQLSGSVRTASYTMQPAPGRSASAFSQFRLLRMNVPELQCVPCKSHSRGLKGIHVTWAALRCAATVNGVNLRCAVTRASDLVGVQLSESAQIPTYTMQFVPGRFASSFSQPRLLGGNVPKLQRIPSNSHFGGLRGICCTCAAWRCAATLSGVN